MNDNNFVENISKNSKNFLILTVLIVVSHAVSAGVNVFSDFAVINFLESSENPSRHLFEKDEFKKDLTDGTEIDTELVGITAAIIHKIEGYCKVVNIALQTLLSVFFAVVFFRK